ncbi:MAG: T9SS type A sorting domain-containing protein [Crocinitomicaceae bacterium]
MKHWLISLIVLGSFSIHAQTWNDLNYNKEQFGLSSNPLKGYATMWDVHTSDPSDPEYVPYSIQGRLFKFDEILTGLNNSTGDYVYDWTLVDDFVQEQGLLGKHVYLQANIDPVQNATLDLPQFILDALAIPDPNTGLSNLVYTNNVVIPNWNHPVLMNAMLDFVTEFGNRYNNDPRVFLVHMGLYGMWGEWHIYPYDQTYPHLEMTQSNKDSLASAFELNFPDKQILARYPESFTNPSSFGYSDGLFFEESFGQPAWYFHNILENHGVGENWKNHPIGGEVSPILQDTLFYQFPNLTGHNIYFPQDNSFRHIQDGPSTLRSLHTTWLFDHYLFADPSQTGLTREERNNAIRLQQWLGYLFYVKRYRITAQNGFPKLDVKIKNEGVAPIYENWDVEFALFDQNDSINVLKTENWDLHTILPGGGSDQRTSLSNIQVSDGIYTAIIRVVNPLEAYSQDAPPLRFANETQDMHAKGWLTIAEITISGGEVVNISEGTIASPYGGFNREIPGTIECEEYNNGGLNLAYSDDHVREGNTKNEFRRLDNVDVMRKANASNNFAVGYTNVGEWLEYTVDVKESRFYDITLNYFCNDLPGELLVTLDGNQIAIIDNIQTFSNSDILGTSTLFGVYLNEGVGQVLRLAFINGGNFEIDNLVFSPVQHIQDGTYTMRSVSGAYLKASGMSSPVESSSSTAGDSTNWLVTHLGDDVYRIEAVQFNNQRIEVPFGNCGAGLQIATTWYTGGEDHLKWKASLINGKLMFEPLHCLGTALDAVAINPNQVQIDTKDETNNDQLFELLPASSNISSLSMEEVESLQAKINIYPNPVRTELTIYIPEAEHAQSEITIFDVNGKILYSKVTSKTNNLLNANVLNLGNIFMVRISNSTRSEVFRVVRTN